MSVTPEDRETIRKLQEELAARRKQREENERKKKMSMEDHAGKIIGGIAVLFVGGIVAGLVGCPAYNVYTSEKAGEAAYKKAEQDRKIKVLEAEAKLQSAKLDAQSEVERAKGVAEANRIVGDGLKGNEDYLRYLWIDKVAASAGHEVIYVPTEASIPILEAGKAGK